MNRDERYQKRAGNLRRAVPNPCTGGLKPVELITDRAKRYRAQAANAQREKRCIYCGASRGRLDTEHINGKEADNTPANLGYACRPCNTQKGALFTRLGLGRKTAQFNPAAAGAANVFQWSMAVDSIRRRDPKTGRLGSWAGKSRPMSVSAAIAMIRATPPDDRSRFAREMWRSRYAHGTDRRTPF